MTRLMQVMAGARHGGAEAFFTRLASALGRAGQAQTVAIRADAARAATLRHGGVEVTELPFGGWLDFTTRRELRSMAKAWRPDVVLSWMNRASALMPTGPYVRVGRLGGYYDLKYYRDCDHLVGNTRDIVAYLVAKGWPADRAHYLPNFVDDAPLPAIPRADLATPDGVPLLLALGRLHRVKGFDVLLRALARLPDAYLWVAGEGVERGALEGLAAELGVAARVRWLGWRDDMAALLAAADILVCPSRHEPLGNVVLEAWAHRVPVVVTASEGPRALVQPGESGLLIPIGDVEAIATSVRTLTDHPSLRAALAQGGYAAFAAEYAEAAVVRRYRDFIGRVALERVAA